jgi:hypothetical protein
VPGRDVEITESVLTAQHQGSSSAWPFIHQAGLARVLPGMPLLAVGSREINLTNEVGDFGPGHGVWQHERTGPHHRTREEP